MIGINTKCERSNTYPPRVVAVTASTPTDVLPDRRSEGKVYVHRYIQNVGAGNLYFAYDIDCNLQQNVYHGVLPSMQQLAVDSYSRVSVYSDGTGGTVATIEQERVNT